MTTGRGNPGGGTRTGESLADGHGADRTAERASTREGVRPGRWLDALGQSARDGIVRLETESASKRERLTLGLGSLLVGVVGICSGLVAAVAFLPAYLLGALYPNRWCAALGKVPVLLLGIGVAAIGCTAKCVRTTGRPSRTAVRRPDSDASGEPADDREGRPVRPSRADEASNAAESAETSAEVPD